VGSKGRLLAAAALAAGVAWALRDVPAAMGARPAGDRAERVRRSPQFRDGKFRNTVPSSTVASMDGGRMFRELFFGEQIRKPARAVPIVVSRAAHPARPPADSMQVTWYGHASSLLEMDGGRVLFDPVWSARCSPSRLLGPRRLHPPPVSLQRLPRMDAIVISHDHYDHLDMATVRRLVRLQTAPFVVPLGVGAHLQRWRVPESRIIELDWDESVALGGLTLTLTAARHFSGRGLRRDGTLWGSWVVSGPTRRAFYTGDSGYFDGYAAIGAEHGPFDATLVQIGAYGPDWPDIHMTPEEALNAHLDLRGGLLIPVHWCTFVLAFHDWSEPADWLWREATARDVRLAVPRPGERVDVLSPPPVDGWWQRVS
jgi:L-ascorbate metabolism protein UlaG (beta-lactamase superfamily)